MQGRVAACSVSRNHPKTTSATSFYHSLVSVSFKAGIPFQELNEENGSLIDSIAIGIGFLSLAR